MPWNEPGGNGKNNDPWGKRDQGPPALDKVFSDLLKKLNALFLGKKGPSSWQPSNTQNTGFLAGIIAVVVLVIWFLSGLYIVNPAEEAVILTFGKYSETQPQGLHWMARFINTKYLIDVQKIYSFSLQGDFLTKSSEQSDLPNQYSPVETTKKAADGSSDQSKNLVNVELNVQYRISDPRAFLFSVVDPDATLKAVASGTLSDVVGQMKLDEVLTTGRELLSSSVLDRMKKVLEPYNTGIEVKTVNLRKVQAPEQVREAFNDVNVADQQKATTIQGAQAYASREIPVAQGLAARILADANAYQQQVVLNAQANIAKYQALLRVYAVSPDITKQRMYLETMESILQRTSKVLIDSNAGNNLLYLPLDKMMSESNRPQSLASFNNDNGVEVRNDTP
jgi:membrane protease subunit HflK